MKLWCVILSWSVLFAGCYSHTTATKDSPNLDNEELTFTLNDGSHIISKGGQHQRVESGYKIVGSLRHTPKDNWNTLNYQRPDSLFDGILLDENIKEVVAVELDAELTIGAAVGGCLSITLFTLLTIAGNQVTAGI